MTMELMLIFQRFGKYKYSSIVDYINWTYKWHKILQAEMEKVADRICMLYERGINL